MYQSTFVRYERVGDKVTPVRVTKQWVNREVAGAIRGSNTAFKVVRVTELRRFPVNEAEPGDPTVPAWTSSDRRESRERVMNLLERSQPEGECLVREAGYTERWLPFALPSPLPAYVAGWTLDNGNGWVTQ